MAQPVDFPGSNIILGGGSENINDMRVHRNRVGFVSCWELSDAEIEEIVRTRKIYHYQMTWGHSPFPVLIAGSDTMREFTADAGKAVPEPDPVI